MCKALIAHNFPELAVRTTKAITVGWDSFVLDVNDELIFRFPMRPDVEERLAQERRLLPILEARLSTPIPHFTYFGTGNAEYPRAFVGYRKIGGTPMEAENLAPRKGALAALAPAVASFLNELHSFPLALAPQAGFADNTPNQWRQAWRDDYQERYADLQRRVFPLLDSDLREGTRRLWEGFLNAEQNFLFQPTLTHCDLACEHIFCDPERGTLTGVIDWGDATIGDPALDFVGLHGGHGRIFVEYVLAHYTGTLDAAFWRRMDFYLCYHPYSQLLYGSYENNQAFIERGLQGLRELFPRPLR